MKYKVGDKVKVKSREWYDGNKDWWGNIFTENGLFLKDMSDLCGMDATILRVGETVYKIDIDDGRYKWDDYMFEEQPKNESNETGN